MEDESTRCRAVLLRLAYRLCMGIVLSIFRVNVVNGGVGRFDSYCFGYHAGIVVDKSDGSPKVQILLRYILYRLRWNEVEGVAQSLVTSNRAGIMDYAWEWSPILFGKQAVLRGQGSIPSFSAGVTGLPRVASLPAPTF